MQSEKWLSNRLQPPTDSTKLYIYNHQCLATLYTLWGWGNSIMVNFFVCQAGRPGSSPAQSICFRKVEFFQSVINLSPPVSTTGSPKPIHVLSCLCDTACKRSLVICRKNWASCPVSRLLPVPIWPACAEQGRWYDFKQTKTTALVTFK